MTHRIRHWLAIGCLLLATCPAFADEHVRIGIQAYRPKPQALAQWAPLAVALNKAIPGYQFDLAVYSVDELTEAVSSRQVDFILTNPGQIILLDHRAGLSAPLASLNNLEHGKPVSSFGGVIFTRAQRTDIQRLQDLRGKSVAAISVHGFGGYQMQAYELLAAGLRVPQDLRLVTVKAPQDNVVDAVVSGRADVGFVRTGVLEGLARTGKLDLAGIKIINPQYLPGFPVQVSTRLYPEWVVAGMPHTDKQLKRKIASFLLNIADDTALTRTLGIQGFDVPQDYSAVEKVLRELRAPPFDVMPAFSLRDVWQQYRLPIIISLVATGLLLLLAFRLLLLNRKLQVSEAKLGTMLKTINDLIWLKNPEGVYLACNPMFERFFGAKEADIVGKTDYDFVDKELANLFRENDRLAMDKGTNINEEWVSFADDGHRVLLETTKTPMHDKSGQLIGVLGVGHDITERKSAEAKIQRLTDLYAALSQCNQAIVRCANKEELFPQICRDAVQFGKMKMAWIGLVDAETRLIRPVASFGDGTEYLDGIEISLDADKPSGQGPTGIACRENQPVWCQDYQNDPMTAPWRERSLRYGWGASAALPLLQDGLVAGVFCLYTGEVDAFDAAARNLLVEMAMDISYALDRFSNEHRRIQAQAQLNLAAEVFSHSNEGFIITGADRNIILVNEAFTRITGYSQTEVLGQNPRILSSNRQDPTFYRAMWESINTEGFWRGEIWNRKKDGSLFPEWLSITRVLDDEGQPTHYIGIFTDITEQKNAEDRIHWLAHFDELTGLPNRTLLTDRIAHAISMSQRSGESLALMFLDLDHFKNVNDSLGHLVGDQLLIQLAERLKANVRSEDTVARLGGDEFIMLLCNSDVNGATHVAEKMLATIAMPFIVDQYQLTTTPSIGIAMYPTDGADMDELFKSADAAMYRAKQSGRNAYRFFTPEMQTHSVRRMQLENALRTAIEEDQLTVHYQPQVSLESGRIIGAEALLRWQHPELGMVSPAEFIPIAEDTGQILKIGEWVLRNSVNQMRAWIDSGLSPIIVAVNISAVQFRQSHFPELVLQILSGARLPPEYLELELTEGVTMNDPHAAIAMMDKLHTHSIQMSIDDFGTGYSSLSHLKRFQTYKLKIDQSFVRDITVDSEDKAIVSAIIQMSKSLGLKTIAEGVETEGQLAFLRDQGCDEVQGYYYSRPLPAEAFKAFLQKMNPIR